MAQKLIAAYFMLNLALFALVPTKAATSTTCPDLNVCASMAAGSLNIAFGSQSSSQCCSKLNGLSESDVVTCICNTIKSVASTTIPPGTALLGGVTGTVGGLLGTPSSLPATVDSVVNNLNLPGTFGGALNGVFCTTTLTQQFSAIINACGLTTPTTFPCA